MMKKKMDAVRDAARVAAVARAALVRAVVIAAVIVAVSPIAVAYVGAFSALYTAVVAALGA